MKITHTFTWLVTCVLLGCAEPRETAAPDAVALSPGALQHMERARQLAQTAVIIDTHIDVPYRLHKSWEDVSVATESGDFDFPRATKGGLNALFMSIYIPADVDAAGDAKEFADGLINSVERIAIEAPDQFAVATCTRDIQRIRDAGKIAMPMGMENGGPIEGSFENLAYFADRGIRYITLAHSKSNHIADSSYDSDERWGGLSEFGKTLIPQMNRAGVMVDVSHISDRAFWQVMELTRTPVLASHSSLRHFTPGFQRNMSDDMVAQLAQNGGVIQINFGSGFLTAAARAYANASQKALSQFRDEQHLAADDPRLTEFAASYRQDNPYPYATVEDVANHIDRAVELAGVDHVGLGSDYDGVGDSLPMGLKDASQYPNLVATLIERGYSDADISKILGGNLLRVWGEVEAFAADAGNPPQCRQPARDAADVAPSAGSA